MNFVRITYKFVVKCSCVICRGIDYTITWFKFLCLCDEFHNFHTWGIPFVNVSFKEKGKIRIGKNFRMNNGMSGNQIGFGKTPCVLQALGGNITIGDNVGMSQTAILALADVTIGNNVLLGGGVKIYTSDFHSLDYVLRRNVKIDAENMKNAPVTIGDDCFIGAGTIVLKGVTIGSRSIVGAGSVVTNDVPPDSIVAGSPARLLRKIS